jgi:hypothetical protein
MNVQGLRRMETDEILAQKAYRNAIDVLLTGRRLPLNVFKGLWSNFFFFESDSIFEPAFVAVMNDLLDAEDAHVCCLVNLGVTTETENNTLPSRYLDRSTSPEYYMSLLRGNGSPDAWLYLVDRYVCISDKGGWCIYCEKENDIAVIAIRNENEVEKFAKALQKLQASSIKLAYRPREKAGFKFEKLTSSWLSTLVVQFSSSAS